MQWSHRVSELVVHCVFLPSSGAEFFFQFCETLSHHALKTLGLLRMEQLMTLTYRSEFSCSRRVEFIFSHFGWTFLSQITVGAALFLLTVIAVSIIMVA